MLTKNCSIYQKIFLRHGATLWRSFAKEVMTHTIPETLVDGKDFSEMTQQQKNDLKTKILNINIPGTTFNARFMPTKNEPR